jgi:nitrite reductase/ring-hydroxylating ferredoxin subunit/uncharacterized membrane protein
MTAQLVVLSSATLNRLTSAIENAEWLDGPSEWVSNLLRRVIPPGPVSDVLTGSPLGHPLHPVLVAIPIGSWAAATYLDLSNGSGDAAERLVALGALAALPTALSGAADLVSTTGAERRVGAVHAAANGVALALYTKSWLARRSGNSRAGKAWALAGAAAIGVSGWLGGHLACALGVGVDTTSFQHLPAEWTGICDDSELTTGHPLRRDVDGVPVLLVRTTNGIFALADRCTHRGGPLHEGAATDDDVTCPWHGSTFRLTDGEVVSGPASRPQTVLEVRIQDERVEVRRPSEPRALRTNPVGV